LDLSQVYPDYLADYNIMVCPSSVEAKQAFKLGWLNVGGSQSPIPGPFDPCRVGFTDRFGDEVVGGGGFDIYEIGTGHADVPYSYMYCGYACSGPNASYAFDYITHAVWESASGWNGDTPNLQRLNQDVKYAGGLPTGANTVHRLKEGVEQYFITDIHRPAGSAEAQSSIPVMWDRCMFRAGDASQFNHVPSGANILYMDGSVRFMRYMKNPDDQEFPLDDRIIFRQA